MTYSGPSLKGHSLERTPQYKGHKCLAASTVNACGDPSHQRTPLIRKDFFLAEGVSLLEGGYCITELGQYVCAFNVKYSNIFIHTCNSTFNTITMECIVPTHAFIRVTCFSCNNITNLNISSVHIPANQ